MHRRSTAAAAATALALTGVFAFAAPASAEPLQEFTSPLMVEVEGWPAVGEQLWADIETETVPSADDYEYQWYADGAPVIGATDSEFILTPAQLDQMLTVVVTPVLGGFDPASGADTSEPTAPIEEGSFSEVVDVDLLGEAIEGQTLTALIDSDAEPQPTSYEFRWFADDELLEGETDDTLYLGPDLVGAEIVVEARPILYGYRSTSGEDTSSEGPVEALVADFETAVVPEIEGDPAVGDTLSIELEVEAFPTPDYYEYLWLADGELIDGADSDEFEPTPDELGKTISVVATPVLEGYDSSTGEGESLATEPVVEGDFDDALDVDIDGEGIVGETLFAFVDRESVPAATSYAFQWYADGDEIVGATDDELYVGPEYLGAEIMVVVTPTLVGYVSASGADDTDRGPIEAATFEGALDVDIQGLAQVGSGVTAIVTGELDPEPTTVALQWYADGAPIAGATSDELVLTADLEGAELSVRVTASLLGYADATGEAEAVTVLAAPAVDLAIDTVTSGGDIVVSGTGFFGEGDLTVELHSDPVVLGTITPAADGTFSGRFAVPAGTPAGTHTVVVLDASGAEIASTALTVTAPPAAAAPAPASETLPATGSDFDGGALALGALALLVLGVVLRRRATA